MNLFVCPVFYMHICVYICVCPVSFLCISVCFCAILCICVLWLETRETDPGDDDDRGPMTWMVVMQQVVLVVLVLM